MQDIRPLTTCLSKIDWDGIRRAWEMNEARRARLLAEPVSFEEEYALTVLAHHVRCAVAEIEWLKEIGRMKKDEMPA